MLLEFARPETLIYTNIGMGLAIDQALREAGAGYLLDATGVIECYHGRGFDELWLLCSSPPKLPQLAV